MGRLIGLVGEESRGIVDIVDLDGKRSRRVGLTIRGGYFDADGAHITIQRCTAKGLRSCIKREPGGQRATIDLGCLVGQAIPVTIGKSSVGKTEKKGTILCQRFIGDAVGQYRCVVGIFRPYFKGTPDRSVTFVCCRHLNAIETQIRGRGCTTKNAGLGIKLQPWWQRCAA